ncbi:unnamed protein product [Ascophyllum nodosum]
MAGTTTAEYCAQHAPDGMVNIFSRKGKTEGFGKQPLFGVEGTKTEEYCVQHTLDGMVDVCNRKYRTEGCGSLPSFGVAGTKTAEYCPQHASYEMVDVCSKKCRTQGCGKKPLFGVANTRTTEYCAQHARLKCGVGPHHSGNKTIGYVTPTGATAITFRPSPTNASPPSGASWGSRKRVRHPENTCTAPKRVFAQESSGGAVITPDIEGQKSLVRGDTSVKTEVQLSL